MPVSETADATSGSHHQRQAGNCAEILKIGMEVMYESWTIFKLEREPNGESVAISNPLHSYIGKFMASSSSTGAHNRSLCTCVDFMTEILLERYLRREGLPSDLRANRRRPFLLNDGGTLDRSSFQQRQCRIDRRSSWPAAAICTNCQSGDEVLDRQHPDYWERDVIVGCRSRPTLGTLV